MATSPRLNWPTPDEFQDPWYDPFIAMVDAMDSSGYAAREDRQIVFTDGGLWSFSINPLNNIGTVTWTSTFNVTSALSGFLEAVPAASAQLISGQAMYVELVRAPTSNVTLEPAVANQVPSDDNALLICIMVGTNLYFRNGKVLNNGSSGVALFTSSGGGGFGAHGQLLRVLAPIALGQSTPLSSPDAVGDFALNPSDYAITGTTLSIYFEIVAAITGGATGQVVLYNLTDSATVATLSVTSAGPTKQLSSVLSLPVSEKVYEVRINITVGSGTLLLPWAGFQIDHAF